MKRGSAERAGSTTDAVLRHWRELAPDDRLAHLIKDTWRGLMRAFQARLAEHEVSGGHWPFLRILWERDGLTLSELSKLAGLMVPTTFAAVNAMERLGYVTREQREQSKRKVYVFLTSRGRALKKQLVPIAEQVNAVAVRGVPARQVEDMRRTLLAMIENLATDEAELRTAKRKIPSTRDLAHLVRRPRRKPTARSR